MNCLSGLFSCITGRGARVAPSQRYSSQGTPKAAWKSPSTPSTRPHSPAATAPPSAPQLPAQQLPAPAPTQSPATPTDTREPSLESIQPSYEEAKDAFYSLMPTHDFEPDIYKDNSLDTMQKLKRHISGRTYKQAFTIINTFNQLAKTEKEVEDTEDLKFRILTLWMHSSSPPKRIEEIAKSNILPHAEDRANVDARVFVNGEKLSRRKAYRRLTSLRGVETTIINGPYKGFKLGYGAFGKVRLAFERSKTKSLTLKAIKKTHLKFDPMDPQETIENFYSGYREWYINFKASKVSDRILKPSPLHLYKTRHAKRRPDTTSTLRSDGYILAFAQPKVTPIRSSNQYTITQKTRLQILKDTILATRDLHASGIVHGDIKLNNIGRHKGTYKLLDTGLSTPFKEYGPELATALSILRHTVEQHGGTLPSERTMEIKRTPKEIERPSETYAGRDDIYAIAQLGCYVLGKETAYDYCVRTTHLGDDFVFHSPHHNDRHHHFPSERSHYIDPDLPLANRITEEEADAVEALISRCLNHPETSIEDLLTSPLFRPPSARSLVSGLS